MIWKAFRFLQLLLKLWLKIPAMEVVIAAVVKINHQDLVHKIILLFLLQVLKIRRTIAIATEWTERKVSPIRTIRLRLWENQVWRSQHQILLTIVMTMIFSKWWGNNLVVNHHLAFKIVRCLTKLWMNSLRKDLERVRKRNNSNSCMGISFRFRRNRLHKSRLLPMDLVKALIMTMIMNKCQITKETIMKWNSIMIKKREISLEIKINLSALIKCRERVRKNEWVKALINLIVLVKL